ncbi:MAG: hypothetical protein CVV22_06610 [Ignavibacteriae bacterium HGW-Ignavibacteriae-1]|jgi:Lon protease-like protein|nr:MAG: hypothetical protein CVV22_06610 [Ignavibacteriae bacterium HGW-Ignavibacteriae-1]
MKKIGIFPLRLVLFPESAYPLHIFEERYKALISKCLQERAHFGINFMSNEGMKDVGCSATITEVLRHYDDGRMDIVVAGVKRYKLKSFADGADKYYVGDVDYFDDIDNSFNPEQLEKCVEIYNRIADTVKTIKIETIAIETISSNFPSFQLAQKAGLAIEQRQFLLESRNESERLIYLFEHFHKILPTVKTIDGINNLVKNDGYIKPNLPKS